VVQERLLPDAQRRRRGRVRFGDDRHISLQRADNGDVVLVVGLRVELDRLFGLDRAGERLGVALHLQVHTDLEQLQRRQHAYRLRASLAREHVERALQAEL